MAARSAHTVAACSLILLALLCNGQCARQLQQLPGPGGPGGPGRPYQPQPQWSNGGSDGGGNWGASNGNSGGGGGGGSWGGSSGGGGSSNNDNNSNNGNQGWNTAQNTVTGWANGQVDNPSSGQQNNNNNNQDCNIGNNAVIATGNNCNFNNNNNNNGGGSGGSSSNNNNNNNNNNDNAAAGGIGGLLGLLGGGGGGGLPDLGSLMGAALQLIMGFASGGGGIPNLSQAMPFNLGELMNLSATRSTDSNNVITGLADSMLANLANNNAPTVTNSFTNTLSSNGGTTAISSTQAYNTAATFTAAAAKANRVQPDLSSQVGKSFAQGLDNAMSNCIKNGGTSTSCCSVVKQTMQNANALGNQAGTASVFSSALSSYPRVQACQQSS